MASLKHRPASTNRPWTVRWREGGRNRSRGFRRKGEAKAFHLEALSIEAAERNGQYGAPVILRRMTLAERWPEWMATRRDRSVSTRKKHESVYRNWLKPALGSRRLESITHHDLNAVLARATEAGRGADTRRAIYQTLCMLMDDALGPDGHTCRRTTPGTATRQRTIRLVTHEEVEALLAATPERWRLLVDVLATMGLRPGEALELTSADVVDGSLVVRASKTGQTRQLPIPARLRDPLTEAAHETHGELFPVSDYRAWRRRVFKPAAARAGMPELTPYDLGHSVATCLANYSHMWSGRLGELADILDQAL